MSAGAVPIDDETLAAQQAAAAPAPVAAQPQLQPQPAPTLGGGQIIVSAPPLPAEEDTRSVHAPVITAPEKVATAAIPDITADKVAAAQAEGDVHAREAEARSMAADRASSMAKAHELETRQAVESADAEIAKAQEAAKAKYDELSGMKLHDYFSSERGGNRVLAAIIGALGGFNQSYNGGVNIGLQAINNKIEQDFRLQKENIEKEERTAIRLGHDVQAVEARKKQRLQDLALKQAASKDAAAAELEAQLGRHGVPLAQAKTNQTSAALRSDANKELLDTLKGQRTEIVNSHTSRQAAPTPNAGLIFGPGGVPIATTDPKKADAINSRGAVYRQMREEMLKLKASLSKGVAIPHVYDADTARERDAILGRLTLLRSKDDQLGALSGSDLRLESGGLASDPEKYLGEKTGVRIDTAIKNLDESFAKMGDSYGQNGTALAEALRSPAPAPVSRPAAPSAPPARPAPAKKPATPAPGGGGATVREIAKMKKYVQDNPGDAAAKAMLRSMTAK